VKQAFILAFLKTVRARLTQIGEPCFIKNSAPSPASAALQDNCPFFKLSARTI
jgi:hypothetical protein